MTIPLALGLAYAALAALVLTLNLNSQWRREIKIGIIILMSALYFAAYWGGQNLRGWAIASQPPNPFKLHWAIVEEPDKARDTSGAIYILAQQLSPQGALLSRPRLYRLPFSPELAEQIEEARNAAEDGKPIEARLSYKAKKPETEDLLEQREKQGQTSRAAATADRLELNFRELPPPPLPPKSAQ